MGSRNSTRVPSSQHLSEDYVWDSFSTLPEASESPSNLPSRGLEDAAGLLPTSGCCEKKSKHARGVLLTETCASAKCPEELQPSARICAFCTSCKRASSNHRFKRRPRNFKFRDFSVSCSSPSLRWEAKHQPRQPPKQHSDKAGDKSVPRRPQSTAKDSRSTRVAAHLRARWAETF